MNRLKINSELVAVTGDGANDVKALKKAHVGLAMGGGSDVAKQASDIVILDDNFTSILKSVMWGRCVFDNIRKFLQFQLTVNVAALAVAAFSALANKEPLTAVQLLWVNLIMDSFGALALATEPPTEALLDRAPKNVAHPKTSLISPEMWKMILGGALYQTFVLLGGLFLLPHLDLNLGGVVPGADRDYDERVVNTMIFNSFILCQLFNLIACRKVSSSARSLWCSPFLTPRRSTRESTTFLQDFTGTLSSSSSSSEKQQFRSSWLVSHGQVTLTAMDSKSASSHTWIGWVLSLTQCH